MNSVDRARSRSRFTPGAWLWLAGSVFILNLALTFHNQWPTPWITTRHELSVELAVLTLGLCLLAEAGRLPGRRLLGGLAAVFLLFALARYAEVTAPALFGRRINLYWDASHVPAVTQMFLAAAPLWARILLPLGLLAALVALYALFRLCLSGVRDGLQHAPARRALALAAGLAGAAWLAGMNGAGSLRWFSLPVTATYAQQFRFIHDALTGADVTADLDQAPLPRSDLAGASGQDVMVLFLESYGAVAFDRPSLKARLDRRREALATALSDAGLVAVSAFVGSPTFGGASWLAHASLLSGIEIRDNASHAMLLTRRRDTLVHRFRQRGWRPVAVMPGLKRAWPEGGFYGFEQIYDEQNLDYHGPDFGWWRIPDQFSLARIATLELDTGPRPPVFIFYPTISSHAPFRPTPPYQPDWERVLGDSPFEPAAVRASLAGKAGLGEQERAYGDSLAYALRTLAGFVGERARVPGARESLLVVLGDHQPPAAVAGATARHDVPVHIITRPGAVEAALRREGFRPGLTPLREALLPMHRLGPLLLRALAGDRPVPRGRIRTRDGTITPGPELTTD